MVSRRDFDRHCDGEVVLVVASVERVMFSLDTNNVFVEGYITRNRVFVGLADCYEFNRRTESW